MTWAISYSGSCGWMVLCLLSASGVFPSESNRITIKVCAIQHEMWSPLPRSEKEEDCRMWGTTKGRTKNKTNQSKSAKREHQNRTRWGIWQQVKLWVSPKYQSGDCCFPLMWLFCFDHTNWPKVSGDEPLWQSDEENSALESSHSLTFPMVQ